ncbi:MAG: Nramp family divalent metal transporter [Acidobacteria bacterium]|nr:Nramp family divalent metal transporter [Acidobacteriota bacterium]MDA1234422.1 Nramp family divalent metal transporter [Acidobacteriota bacterium]
MSSPTTPPPVPKSFLDFLKAFGPGIIVVLTWLGAGDVVDMGVAGSNYGYSLLWVLVIAVFMRFVLVSLIGRYQLCNQHGEGVLDGLVRFHPAYAPILFFGAVIMGHVYESYMTVGEGEVLRNVSGMGDVWMWAILCNAVAMVLVLKGGYNSLETLFKLFLGLLSISFVGSAVWVGFSGLDLLQGLYRVEMPGQSGDFDPLMVALAMIGAVGGSFMNLVYPYFLEEKGWKGPQYRKVQVYDLLLGVVVMIILNVAVWVLGAELLFPDKQISTLDDLPNLLSTVLGPGGRLLFYVGVFSAVFTSVVGHAVGLAAVGSHALLWWQTGKRPTPEEYRASPTHNRIILWCLISPLIWTIPGMPDFVTLTLAANSGQVVLLPLLAGGIWRITSGKQYIGEKWKTTWWENGIMAILFALAIYGAIQAGGILVGNLMGS